MATGFDIDWEGVERALDRIDAALEPMPGDLDEAAMMLVQRIISRTERGVDADGNPFAPYASSTARDRSRRGRRTQRVTLSDTGKLMAAITHRVSGGAAEVYFSNRTRGRIAHWLNEGTRRMPQRRFFAASERDEEDIARLLVAGIMSRLG